MWALFQWRFAHDQRRHYAAFETHDILEVWKNMPANVVRPERNKRAHLSGVLARNEVERDYAYNRALFKRVAQGWYQFNPTLSVRRQRDEALSWVPIFEALNLSFVNQFASDFIWHRIDEYLRLAGLPDRRVPIAYERAVARHAAERREREREAQALLEAEERRKAEMAAASAARQRAQATAPKWGTPAAKQAEIERIRREIERLREGNAKGKETDQ